MKMMKLVIACALAMSAFASTASATTITPANTNVTLTSTNSQLSTSAGSISCAHSTVTGNTGSGTAHIRSFNVSLAYENCTAFGFPANVTGCTTTTSSNIVLSVTYASSTDIRGRVHIPSGCTIKIEYTTFAGTCVLDVNGPQTVGNGTSGAGGIKWDNHVVGSASRATFNSPTVNVTSTNPGVFGCSSGSGTLSGTYVANPSNITVEA